MKFYCVNYEDVLSEQEEREEYEEYYNEDYFTWNSYEEFVEAVTDKSDRGCITDELDTEKIAASAKLIAKWADDFCGLGGACGKPDAEQFKALYAIQTALEQVVNEQSLHTIYEGVK